MEDRLGQTKPHKLKPNRNYSYFPKWVKFKEGQPLRMLELIKLASSEI